ncbi:ankyrin repeat domain-containing protein [Allorhodopirellula heiligendammensis]|uniref:Ankyrin repeats (3 copies) n=1 Tax=Allorhodopirellula heiligendammensis TaxID=2714739 RepID=A0A5C6C042_9BACT|nr:ankyrin repeat domain-containing protein [Allorhodopirellula heiligendammensis]TWU16876.1 Ankyrin repeats (3 copies) [Allorhodopirellula heiligendammensis]
MSRSSSPKPFDQLFLRHVQERKRTETGALPIRMPFETTGSTSCDGGSSNIKVLGFPCDKWIIVARIARHAWCPVYGNAATAQELFVANKSSKRLEVARVGFDPETDGWFVQISRAGKIIVNFSTSPDGKMIHVESSMARDMQLGSCDGKEAFEKLCGEFEISLPIPRLVADENEFQWLGVRGRPVKNGLNAYIRFDAETEIQGDKSATKVLEKALEAGDVNKLRQAVHDGAALNRLVETSCSAIQSALFKIDRPGGVECVEALIELGCDVNAKDPHEPIIFSCVGTLVAESLGDKMLQLLLSHGANPNVIGLGGFTPLFQATVYQRKEAVRLLIEAGADPTIPSHGETCISRIQQSIEKTTNPTKLKLLSEILVLLGGEAIEQDEIQPLDPDLQSENDYFALLQKAKMVSRILPRQVELAQYKIDRLGSRTPFDKWQHELVELGFEPAGNYLRTLLDRRDLAVFNNPTSHFDVVLSADRGAGGPPMCECQAYLRDGSIFTINNFDTPVDPDLDPDFVKVVVINKATPGKLIRKLTDLTQGEPLEPIEADSFAERYRNAYGRVLAAIQDKVKRLSSYQDAPNLPRYRRLAVQLPISTEEDPRDSSHLFATRLMQDITDAAQDEDTGFTSELAITAMMRLIAMKHFQLAGAPHDNRFIEHGLQIAHRYIDSIQNQRDLKSSSFWFESIESAILAAMLVNRWDDALQFSESIKMSMLSQFVSDDISREYASAVFLIISELREKPIRNTQKLCDEIESSSRKRPKQLLRVLESIRSKDQAAFERELATSLKAFKPPTDAHPMDRLPLADAILVQVAQHRGMKPPTLPGKLRDQLISFVGALP